MVNKIVLEYFRVNRGNYKLDNLKKKALASGYSQKEIDEALVQLNKQTQGNVPSVSKTISQLNKTNLVQEKPGAQVKPSPTQPVEKTKPVGKPVESSVQGQEPKKSKKGLWILLIIFILVLIGAGAAAYWYFMMR